MTSNVNSLFREQASRYHLKSDQRSSSTNDFRTTFDRFSLGKNHSSASAFCGETADGSSGFLTRCLPTLYSSSHSLSNTHHRHRPSSLHSTSAALITPLDRNNANGCQRTSSSLLTNNTGTTTDHQSCFTNHFPTTAPIGSYDQFVDNTNTIAPLTSIDIMSQPSSAFSVFSRNTSITDIQLQQFAIKMPKTTFSYIPASDSLVYNSLTGIDRSSTVRH